MAKAKSSSKDKAKHSEHAHAPEPQSVTQKSRGRLRSELVLGSLFAELAGTFVLAVVALNSAGNIVLAGITVIILVMALNRLSGGHVNPAVTLGLLVTKQISWLRATGYIVAQLLGAMLAYVVVSQFVHTATPTIDPTTGQVLSQAQVFVANQLTTSEHWRPFFAELLGGVVFGLGVGAAIIGRKNSIESGFVVGGSLLLGLIIATLGSTAILNPAIALSISAYQVSNFWSIFAFAIGPVLGVMAGAWLYKLLQWDVTGEKA